MKSVYLSLFACTEDNLLAKVGGLTPRTGEQTVVKLLHALHSPDVNI